MTPLRTMFYGGLGALIVLVLVGAGWWGVGRVRPTAVAAGQGGVLSSSAPTATPTMSERRAILNRQIDVYEELYLRYAPMGNSGEWRYLDLALDSFLPAHPEFAAYHKWIHEVKYANDYGSTAQFAKRSPIGYRQNLSEYLART